MTLNRESADPSPRTFPAHFAVVVLGVVGAIIVQLAWLEIFRREPAASWWPLDVVVILASTGYLLATAELHWRAARWQSHELVPRIWMLGRAMLADLTIAAYVIVVFVRGPQASLYRSGLWILLPTLLALTLAAASVSGLALRNGWACFWTDVPPADAPYGKPKSQLLHTGMSVLILLSFLLIEYVQPQVKPWEMHSNGSHAAADKSVR